MIRWLLFFLMAWNLMADEKIKVVTSTTDLAWAAAAIGKELIDVKPLLTGRENPHYVDAVPRYIQQVADADVVCIIGLELEIGWMPKILARSGNAKVQSGGKGYCETGKQVKVLEKPTGNVDRSMGDIHPFGNPHFWLSPIELANGAAEIRDALVRVDPAHAGLYQSHYKIFQKEMEDLVKTNKARLAPFLAKAGGPFIEYHKEFSYFFDVYGIPSMGSIEEKPGIPPSAGRIGEVALAAKSSGVKRAIAGEYAPQKLLDKFKELSGISYAIVPTSLHTEGGPSDYVAFQKQLVDVLLDALKK